MISDKIFLVRLESGENIAQYTSRTAKPRIGDIINIHYLGHIQPFEILKTTFQPIIENYDIAVLIVKRPATTAILRALIHGQPLRDMLVGLFFGFVLIILPILKRLRKD